MSSCLTTVRHMSHVIHHQPLLPCTSFYHFREFKQHFLFMSSCLTAVWHMSFIIRHHPCLTHTILKNLREFKLHFLFMSSCLTAVWHMSCVTRHHPLLLDNILHHFRKFKPHFIFKSSCSRAVCHMSSVTTHCYCTSFYPISESLNYTLFSCHHVLELFDTCPTSFTTNQSYPHTILRHVREFKQYFLFMSLCLTATSHASFITIYCYPTLFFTISENSNYTTVNAPISLPLQ